MQFHEIKGAFRGRTHDAHSLTPPLYSTPACVAEHAATCTARGAYSIRPPSGLDGRDANDLAVSLNSREVPMPMTQPITLGTALTWMTGFGPLRPRRRSRRTSIGGMPGRR